MAEVAGFEPAMRESKSRALTAWLHLIIFWCWRQVSNLQPADYKSAALPLSHASITIFKNGGDPSEIRTPDILIKSQVLYQLS